jgi:hypothetical protein
MSSSSEKKDNDKLTRISENIDRSMKENTGNIDRYNSSREFIFKSTLSTKNRNSLVALNMPVLEFNISEAFLSRLRGEFAENEPGIMVTIADDVKNTPELEQVRELIEGHLRYIFEEAKQNGVQVSIFDEVVSGGFSVAKVFAEYEEGKTFRQKIVWKKCYDSTLTGFDVLAREASKKDSDYCFELYPYPKERFEEIFDRKIEDVTFSKSEDKFSWYYKIGDEEIVMVADYYEKKKIKTKIVELSDGRVINKKDYEKLVEELMTISLEAPPVIVQEREYEEDKIMRYQLIGDTILTEEPIDNMSMLGTVFFDGNSTVLNSGGSRTELVTRPYLINCLGAQKLYNNLGIALADECQSLSKHKILIAEESISPNYEDHITQPQKYDTLVYRAFYNNDPSKPNPPPIQMARSAFPPEMFALFQYIPTIFQNILGSYDASLGINNNQLSGVAILQGSIHSSYTAKPFINKYILSLNRIAEIILNMIPKVYVNEMSLPVINKEGENKYQRVNGEGQPSLKYDPNSFKIKVSAGAGFAAQQTQAMTQLIQLSQAMPIFAQFMNTKGLGILVDNINIKGADLLKLMAEEFMQELEQQKQMAMQQQQAQQGQPNPMMLREQNKQAEIQMNAHKNEIQAQIDAAKLALEQENLQLKRAELAGKVETEQGYMALEQEKLDAERAGKVIEHAIKGIDQDHRHAKERTELHHRGMELNHRISGNPHFTGGK